MPGMVATALRSARYTSQLEKLASAAAFSFAPGLPEPPGFIPAK